MCTNMGNISLLFSCNIFLWFCNQDSTDFVEWVGKYSLLFCVLEEFVRVSIISFLNVWQTSQAKPSGTSDFLVGRLNLISSIDIKQYSYLFLLEWSLVVFVFQDICPFYLSCQIYWHKVLHIYYLSICRTCSGVIAFQMLIICNLCVYLDQSD